MGAYPTRGHVLIAEGNRDYSRSLSALLELAGYDVETVRDGRDAVEAARAQPPRSSSSTSASPAWTATTWRSG